MTEKATFFCFPSFCGDEEDEEDEDEEEEEEEEGGEDEEEDEVLRTARPLLSKTMRSTTIPWTE